MTQSGTSPPRRHGWRQVRPHRRSALWLASLALLQGCAFSPVLQHPTHPVDQTVASVSSASSLQRAPAVLAGHGGASHPEDQSVSSKPLINYRPGPSPDLQDWRQANDTVARVGGWRAYLQEAQQPPLEPGVLQDKPREAAALRSWAEAFMPGRSAAPQAQGTPEQRAAARAQAHALMSEPLSAEAAVEVALRVHPAVQVALANGDPSDNHEVLQQIVQRIAVVRRAHVEAVAALERSRYMEDVMRAARASAELTRRAAAVGNVGRLQFAREQAFHAESALAHARAVHEATQARERLIRAMGLPEEPQQLRLPERLVGLPAERPAPQELEQLALQTRIDVQRAQREVLQPTLSQATRLQRQAQLDEAVMQARSEVREAWQHWRFTHEAARHVHDHILPLRRQVAEENLLRYNGMLIGVYELLADAREQIGAAMSAIEALRDFWLADADLRRALLVPGAPPSHDSEGAAHAARTQGLRGLAHSSSPAAGGH